MVFIYNLFFLFLNFHYFSTDKVTYEANVKKMLELYKKSGDSHALTFLWKATFDGRRNEINTGVVTSSVVVLQDKCPLLNQFPYVS